MAHSKTKLIIITSNLQNLDATLEAFVKLHCFHPVKSDEFVDLVHGLAGMYEGNPCPDLLNILRGIEKENEIKLPNAFAQTVHNRFDYMQKRVSSIQKTLKSFAEDIKESILLLHKYNDALIQMKNLESLEISLDDMFACDYVYARVGRLPTESVEKLEFYQSKPFIFKSFSTDKNYSWCIYFTSQEYEREVDNIFSSLFFERILIPDFIHGTPKSANESLTKEIEAMNSEIKTVQENKTEFLKSVLEELHIFKSELLLLDRINEAKKFVVGMGKKISITGFVKEKDVSVIENRFESMRQVSLSILPPNYDKRLKPPLKLKDQTAF